MKKKAIKTAKEFCKGLNKPSIINGTSHQLNNINTYYLAAKPNETPRDQEYVVIRIYPFNIPPEAAVRTHYNEKMTDKFELRANTNEPLEAFLKRLKTEVERIEREGLPLSKKGLLRGLKKIGEQKTYSDMKATIEIDGPEGKFEIQVIIEPGDGYRVYSRRINLEKRVETPEDAKAAAIEAWRKTNYPAGLIIY